ncbi:hypothetical protein D3C77_319730 [compost metagenome]
MAHLDGDEQHLIQGVEHRDLHQDGQAARQRIDLLPLIQGHHLLLLLLRIGPVLLLDLLHLGLEGPHLGQALIGLVGQREEHQLDHDRQRQDGQAEIAQHAVEELHHGEDRARQEPEHAPVDGVDEARQAQRFLIGLQHLGALGAGEQALGLLDLAARLDGAGGAQHGGFMDVQPLRVAHREAAFDGLVLGRDQGRQPVFVGDAHPAAGRLLLDARLLGPVLVLDLFGGELAVRTEGADGPLVQDHLLAQVDRNALALDAAVGGDGDGLGPQVGHRVLDREHILVVNRDDAREAQAVAVVPGQFDRGGRGQGLALGQAPDGVGAGHAAGDVRAAPAELGEIGVLHALRAEQLDRRRTPVQRLAVVGQIQVVDARALQRQRAVQLRRLDRHAGDGAQGLGAVLDEDARRRAGRRQARVGRGLARLLLLGGDDLRLAPALGLRTHHHEVVDAHDQGRAHEEDDGVARILVLHRGQRSWSARLGGGARFVIGAGGRSARSPSFGAARGVASLVRADFTSSSKRSQSRSAVPMRAINT